MVGVWDCKPVRKNVMSFFKKLIVYE
ncbi:hypothetical protein M6B38_252540 [Iris pallida]|uniref:Uncharacterized protein n=1 Tax=Iris pallida TaxID=29817 RepID=A0AAX6IJ33_IRIPA|nr:hypothetical protein M6B38_265125 [Iris pallida]KAJ6852834.1 hypothetical protein M6B38_252540 [Iris pallida]